MNVRDRKAKNKEDGPDMVDASGAIQGLWDDLQLHFRATAVVRGGKLLVRGYAHDECSIPDSRRVYQSYKQFDLTGRPELPKVLYFLAYDLYWQAQSDATNHSPDSLNAVELP